MRFVFLSHCPRRCATSGRSRSLATTVFFEAQLLGMNEVPDRPIIDLDAALGKFDYKTTPGQATYLGALQQPSTQLLRTSLRLSHALSSSNRPSRLQLQSLP